MVNGDFLSGKGVCGDRKSDLCYRNTVRCPPAQDWGLGAPNRIAM